METEITWTHVGLLAWISWWIWASWCDAVAQSLHPSDRDRWVICCDYVLLFRVCFVCHCRAGFFSTIELHVRERQDTLVGLGPGGDG